MELIKNIDQCDFAESVLTTGNFDGVHRGHRFLLEQLVERARKLNMPAVVVMFYPHPKQVLSPSLEPYRYLTEEQRQVALMASCGVDYMVQLPFDRAMASWSAEDFIQRILVSKLGMKYFLMGYDHRLGNPRYSDDIPPLAQRYGFVVQRSEPFYLDQVLVSSTQVRNALALSDVGLASRLLGRYYGFECRVVGGKRIGRTIGYPTANLVPCFASIFLPAHGVYAVRVLVDDSWYGGMLQLGERPTLDDGRGLTLEVHIFNFNKDIYEQKIELEFVDFLRDIQKFNHIDDLVSQLKRDEARAKSLLLRS